MGSTNGSTKQKKAVKNLHVEVPLAFHRRVKVQCAIRDCTLKDYALSALEEKVGRDEKRPRKAR